MKRVVAFLTAILLILAMTACSGGKPAESSQVESSGISENSEGPTQEESVTEDDAKSEIQGEEPEASEEPSVVIELTEEEYKARCEEVDYADLAANPDAYIGKMCTFTGLLMDVWEPSSAYIMSITHKAENNSWSDNVLFYCASPESSLDLTKFEIYSGAPIITVWGEIREPLKPTSEQPTVPNAPVLEAKYISMDD